MRPPAAGAMKPDDSDAAARFTAGGVRGTRKEQGDRLMAIVVCHDQRTGIAAPAECAAADNYLISKVRTGPVVAPHWVGYWTLTVVVVELIVPVVKPVVRPLFATERPTVGVRTTLLMVPMSSMKPVPSISPGRS